MGLRINSNLASNDAATSSSTKQSRVKARRLSLGLRISTASDDTNSLASSQSLRAELRLANETTRNADDAIRLIQNALEKLNRASSKRPSSSEQHPQKSNTTVAIKDHGAESPQFTDLIAAIDAISRSAISKA